jgi:vacuolar-type H+-ATPase catalytic subunit A/Vma1
MLRQFFGELVDISSVTNYITQEFIQKDLYEHVDDSCNVKTYQRMLDIVGSKYKIQAIDEKSWLNLSQE